MFTATSENMGRQQSLHHILRKNQKEVLPFGCPLWRQNSLWDRKQKMCKNKNVCSSQWMGFIKSRYALEAPYLGKPWV